MKLNGIPYFGDNNQEVICEALESQVSSAENITLYELLSNLEEKTKVVVVDGKWLTWLEDIQLDYRNHIARIPYYEYSTALYQMSEREKNHNHPHIRKDGDLMYIRFGFDMKFVAVDIGSDIIIFDVKEKRKIRYCIRGWFSGAFAVETLYRLYREYCFYDKHSEYAEHEGGYTFIDIEPKGFFNKEKRVRERLGLKTFRRSKQSTDLPDYRDVRIYQFFEYAGKIKDSKYLIDKLFKYRKLAFESYLFCAMKDGAEPNDYPEWSKLGKTKYYFKITDGNIPMFIKHEWLRETSLVNTKTWRR